MLLGCPRSLGPRVLRAPTVYPMGTVGLELGAAVNPMGTAGPPSTLWGQWDLSARPPSTLWGERVFGSFRPRLRDLPPPWR